MKKINWNDFDTYIKVNNKDGYNLVYLHAFTGSWSNKSNLFNKLDKVNYYCFNMPGHGKTKAASSDDIDVKYYSELAVQFIVDHDLDNVVLMGHSMGGGIAMMICDDSRIANRIKKIILESPANNASLKNFNLIQKLIPSSFEEMEYIGSELFYDPLKFFGSTEKYNEFLKYEYKKLSEKEYLKKIICFNSMTEFNNIIYQGIRENKRPTLLILGDKDNIIPYEETNEVFNNFKNYEIHKIKNSKHVSIAEHPQECFKLIDDFLKI